MIYAILDIEATGGKVGTEKIIDIAIYKFDGEEVIDQFGSMVNPERSIDKYVQKLTGITEKMVKRAPKFYELAKRVIEITEGCVIVGHGVKFDYRMLRQEFKQLGFDFERKTLDTLTLSKTLIPEASSHSLGKLCKELGIPVMARHRADGDTRATLELFKILLEKDDKKQIIQTFAVVEPKNKKQISKLIQLEEGLPEFSGVFYFLNNSGAVFFLKPSRNIKRDVNAILTSVHPNNQRLQSLVTEIEFELTGSFAIALIKSHAEARLNPKLIPEIKPYFGYGLFYNKNLPEPFKIQKFRDVEEIPLLYIPSKERGKKLLSKWQRDDRYDTIQISNFKDKVINHINFPTSNLILLDKGRNSKEKSFVEVRDNKIMGYGYFTFYNQLEDNAIREKLLVHIPFNEEINLLLKSLIQFHRFRHIIQIDRDNSIQIPKQNDRKR